MTWWLWLIGSVWAAFSVTLTACWAVDRYRNWQPYYYEGWGGIVFWAISLTGLAVFFTFLHHFDPGSNEPPAKTRTCTVQQLQSVLVGKVWEQEWVCIGWETNE